MGKTNLKLKSTPMNLIVKYLLSTIKKLTIYRFNLNLSEF